MKNIHLIPTDKPSRLVLSNNSILTIIEESNYNFSHIKSVHIYITSSDEEIKEGDWVYRDSGIVFKMTQELLEYYESIKDKDTHTRNKIILTTDPDLISDGVQAIDDEFLEWFVKNPSCEVADVKKQYITPLGDVVDFCYDNERLNYKIIIPQEEPTIVRFPTYYEPKQETLEEASWRYNPVKKLDAEFIRQAFKEGAKWMAERMYSEEEAKKLIVYFLFARGIGREVENVNKWFEQFKKK